MIRRNDGEVHWDDTGCVFHDEASASQEARLMTDSDPDGYSFCAFALRSSDPRQAVPDGMELHELLAGFEVRVEHIPLVSPATYLEEVRVSCEFQPGKARGIADAIRSAIAAAPSAGRMGVDRG